MNTLVADPPRRSPLTSRIFLINCTQEKYTARSPKRIKRKSNQTKKEEKGKSNPPKIIKNESVELEKKEKVNLIIKSRYGS